MHLRHREKMRLQHRKHVYVHAGILIAPPSKRLDTRCVSIITFHIIITEHKDWSMHFTVVAKWKLTLRDNNHPEANASSSPSKICHLRITGRPINDSRCQSVYRDANEGLFYFGSDDDDVAEIGGRVPRCQGVRSNGREREKERDSIISRLIMRYRVCLMFRQRRSDWGVSIREKGVPWRTIPFFLAFLRLS